MTITDVKDDKVSENDKVKQNNQVKDNYNESKTDYEPKEGKWKIIPLSCDCDLTEDDCGGLDEYINCLNEAFANPRIRNIAVTGGFGVGKSSIISTYNNRKIKKEHPIRSRFWRNTQNRRFLYVGLGNYSIDGNYKDSIDAVENRMLLQIYSRFKHNPPLGLAFRPIPENPSIYVLLGVLAVIFPLALLLMKSVFAELIVGLKTVFGSVTPICNAIDFFIKSNDVIELLLYLILFTGVFSLVYMAWKRILPKFANFNVHVNANDIEASIQSDQGTDYLDRYAQELVYCLNYLGKDIDYTVVLEDMDRLDENTCIRIFTRLREISNAINSSPRTKRLFRFVFVMNDCLAAKLEQEKFFDYVMPVIPSFNEKSAAVKLENALAKMDFFVDQKLIIEAAKYIDGYRQMSLIVNDCYALRQQSNPKDKTDPHFVSHSLDNDIFAFASYKHLCSDDYCNFINNKPCVIRNTLKDNTDVYLKYLKLNCHLHCNVYFYSGFSEDEFIDYFDKKWDKFEENYKNEMMELIECENRNMVNFILEKVFTQEESISILASAVDYILESDDSVGFDVFFEHRTATECLEVLHHLESSYDNCDDRIYEFMERIAYKNPFACCKGSIDEENLDDEISELYNRIMNCVKSS